jgi:hypothetical protein
MNQGGSLEGVSVPTMELPGRHPQGRGYEWFFGSLSLLVFPLFDPLAPFRAMIQPVRARGGLGPASCLIRLLVHSEPSVEKLQRDCWGPSSSEGPQKHD